MEMINFKEVRFIKIFFPWVCANLWWQVLQMAHLRPGGDCCQWFQEQEKIEQEREKLRLLEAQRYETEQLLENCREEEEEEILSERLKKEQDQLDGQRRIFDDLEFQQLEVRLCKLYNQKRPIFC